MVHERDRRHGSTRDSAGGDIRSRGRNDVGRGGGLGGGRGGGRGGSGAAVEASDTPERIEVSVVTRLEVRGPGWDNVAGPIHNAAVLAAINPELRIGGLVDMVGANWTDPATGRGQDRSRRLRALRSSGLFDNDRIAWWVRSDATDVVDLCVGLLADRSGSVAALRSFAARVMGRGSVGRWTESRCVRGAEASSVVLDGAPLITARRSELADLVGALGLVLLARGDHDTARDLEAIGRALLWPLHRRHSPRAAAHELAGPHLQSIVDDLTVLLRHVPGSTADPGTDRVGSRRAPEAGMPERPLPTTSRAERHASTLVADLEALGAGLAGRSPLPLQVPGASREATAHRFGEALANLRGLSDVGMVTGEDVSELDAALRGAPALIDVAPTLLRFCPLPSRQWEHGLLSMLGGPSPYAGSSHSPPR